MGTLLSCQLRTALAISLASMSVLAALGVAALLLFALLRIWQHWRRYLSAWRLYRAMSRLPGPPMLPIVHFLYVITSNRYERVLRYCRRYNTVLRYWFSPDFTGVVLLEPKDIKAILGNPMLVDKPEAVYELVKETLSPGLPFHPQQVWKPIRAAVEKSLNKSVQSTLLPTFCENAAQTATTLEELAEKDTVFKMISLCARVTHHTIIDTILSADRREISDEDRRKYVEVVPKGSDIAMRRIWRPWLQNDWLFSFTKDWKTYHDCIDFSVKLVQRVVSDKREALAREKLEDNQRTRGHKSFVDHALASDSPFVGDLEVESRVLMLAGSGTSMEALSFVYYVLAVRQDLQAAIFKELDEVFGGDALRPVEDADLPRLQAVERLIKETLRFFPPLPIFARTLPADVELPSGYTLPRGCMATLFLPAVHRDPRWWERPDHFDPDRFLPENCRGRHPFAYLPFGGGPRNCVGLRYAMLYLKTHVATVLRRVQLLPAPGAPSRVEDIPVTFNGSTSIIGGGRVRVRRRAPVAQ